MVGPYEVDLKRLLAKFKFERQRAAARILAQLLDDRLPYFKQKPLVTFVPTATSRVRQRGYDHSRLLAEELAKLRGWKCLRLLARAGQSRQVGSLRRARKKQLAGAYRAIRKQLIKNQEILIIDDISTTGATLNETARVLRRAGARQVNAALIARKL
ncbi:MAG: phosphoribosyltransferase family protein [Candidatus Saccharimonadales bacterium]|nr:phosphoribosyltransferase family protein [Candidatus Saccharimonadales bacterium]